MRYIYWILCLGAGMAITSSCIREEAPNAEADILSCTVEGDILKREPIIENNKVTLMVKADADLLHQAPQFELTPGATISPASGTELSFIKPQYYTVTSEDRKWTKEYEVSYVIAGINREYHFERVRQEKGSSYVYDVFFDMDSVTGNMIDWASGNIGFALIGKGSTDPASFPTSSTSEGYIGKGVKLVTMDTGSFGATLGMPIAAGNLFMGTFQINLGNALKSLKLGMPFTHVPTYLKGYYKYKAGERYQEKGTVVEGKKDTWDLYAVFYEVTADVQTLDGTIVEDNYSHPNIVSVALLDEAERVEADQWTEVYIPFVMKSGKTIDRQKLENGGYNVTIVASSSKDGNYFYGAPGSTLYIDELELICMDDEE